ncbi:MAG: DUF3040 domain-containing protein [Terrimesophilobacter sp.]
MPLSEQEQHLLDEMERNLYHNDGDIVTTVSSRVGKPNYRSIVVGILVGILGIAVIVTGVVVHVPLVGVAGFVVLFGGVLLALSHPKPSGNVGEAPAQGRAEQKAGFMDRMNDRWEKRQNDHDS